MVSRAEEVEEILREARETRRRMADWDFIERQPPKVREALKVYVETGDLYVASRIAGVSMDEMNELRVKARIPHVL